MFLCGRLFRSELGVVSHDRHTSYWASQWVVVIVNEVTCRVGHETFEGW